MSEWSNETVLKTVIWVTISGVRIPSSPYYICQLITIMSKAKIATSKSRVQFLLEELEESQKIHNDVALEMLRAEGKKLYIEDFYCLAMMQRSRSVIRGFCNELRDNNFFCAAPLVRLHLDTLLNTFALFLVKDSADFALKKFEGKQTSNLKDRNGVRMQDSHLARELSNSKDLDAAWALHLYEETSKFVHISDKHLLGIFEKVKKNGDTDIKVSETIDLPDNAKIETLEAMKSITFCLFRLWNGWIYTKSNPQLLYSVQTSNKAEEVTNK